MSQDIFDKPVEMSQFFDERADNYEEHMRQSIPFFEEFYDLVSDPIAKTNDKISILDLGCGTGLEFEGVFAKAPNALITGVDISENMLSRLENKYQRFLNQIKLIKGSFELIPFQEKQYDYVLSVMAMHHLLHTPKRELYEKVRKSLKGTGKYIEGDYVVSPEKERQFLLDHNRKFKCVQASGRQTYHVDIPFSIKTQIQLMLEAGFHKVKVIWKESEAAIFVAEIK